MVKSQDWRDKKYVLYKSKKELKEEKINLLEGQDGIMSNRNFEKEIEK